MSHWNGVPFYWEIIDKFIEDCDLDLGDDFDAQQVRGWMYRNNIRGIDASVALNCHRLAEDRRRYGTERFGFGPKAFHRVISTPYRRYTNAASSMHDRWLSESLTRWTNEYVHRMAPVAAGTKRGRKLLIEAREDIHKILVSLGRDMNGDGPA